MSNSERYIQFDLWANREMLSALEKASDAPEMALKIAGHIAGINEMWLARIEGAPPLMVVWPNLTISEMRLCFADQAERWMILLRDHGETASIAYIANSGDKVSNRIDEIVQECLLHAAHHRGQVALLLRLHHHEPPTSTDFIPALRRNIF